MREIAILVDGGFFLKRIRSLGYLPDPPNAAEAIRCFRTLCDNHLNYLNKIYGMSIPPRSRNSQELWRPVQNKYAQLYRIFFYDAPPFEGRAHKPVSGEAINFKTSAQAEFRRELFENLKKTRNVALRLGKVASHSRWILNTGRQKALLKRKIQVDDLTDDDFSYDLKQKGVDMRLGLDIASLTLKKQARTIVLVTGDADFVPAAKLARREGVEIILDPLRNNISDELFEHIDGLRHGLNRAELPECDTESETVDGEN